MAKDAFLPATLLQQRRDGGKGSDHWGDTWSLLKPRKDKGGWVEKVEEGVWFSLKRWCRMFENLPLHLIWSKPIGEATATKAVSPPQRVPLLSQGFPADAALSQQGQECVRARLKSSHRGCVCLTWINSRFARLGDLAAPRTFGLSTTTKEAQERTMLYLGYLATSQTCHSQTNKTKSPNKHRN